MPNRSNTQAADTTRIAIIRLLGLFIITSFFACNNDPDHTNAEAQFDLSIRLGFEPDRLNPMLSKQTQATQIEGMIFLPLADYNPFNLKLEPVLLKSPPKITQITDGLYAGGSKYEMEIMNEARWDDGTPVTGHDYAFTMKAALDPYLVNTAWKAHMEHITEINIDSTNPNKITVLTNNRYILSEEVITTNDVYPEHIYDPQHLLKPYSFATLKSPDAEHDLQIDSILHDFADRFNDEKYSRSVVSGAGPYTFVEWIPNQQVVLKRKDQWWGALFEQKHPSFQAKPASITYYMIPDAQTAITALKDGKVNLVAELSPEQYTGLQQYNDINHSLTLEAPSVLQYYFIAYNSDRPGLREKAVRQAITRLMNVQSLIDQLFFGLAEPTVGPIPPQHKAYDQDLIPIGFDPAAAKKLLDQSGWKDTDQDGVIDKIVDGKKHDLHLHILTSRLQLSQDVAIILKVEVQKLGIKMDIIPDDLPKLLQDLNNGDFDLVCLSSSHSIGPYDPYNYWHSQATTYGSNHFNFRNSTADSLITLIRETLDEDQRNQLYKQFQKILFEEQPALFLVSPRVPIAATSDLIFKTTTLRPGYFENTISLKK
ncbi:MAG: hypothetical protein IPL46_27625 [Saprospiraceae bacterium]|nr:hypothetical protein [Saprospiraceae bacterium]